MNRGIVKVFGEESFSFLQNIITNDLNLCRIDYPIYSCLLNPRGRYQFDFFIIKIDDYFLIDITKDKVNSFIDTLKYRKLFSKVDFQEIHQLRVYNTTEPISSSIISYKDPRLSILGYRTISDKLLDTSLLFLQYDIIRYENAIPDSSDFTFDKSIPIEFGMEELNALNYKKGCYLGQEFTNSLKHRMVIRKRIVTIISNTILNKGDIIFDDEGNKVGEIVSSLENLSLALFKMSAKECNLFVNNNQVSVIIPEWIKEYSLD